MRVARQQHETNHHCIISLQIVGTNSLSASCSLDPGMATHGVIRHVSWKRSGAACHGTAHQMEQATLHGEVSGGLSWGFSKTFDRVPYELACEW
eukprot:6486393-Amphidinium_carterae.2